MGMNAIAIPPGYETGRHYHEEQEETYFIHRGTVEMTFGDGTSHVLGPGGIARVDAPTVRKLKNVGDDDALYFVVGGKDGYVGRDGKMPGGETSIHALAPGSEPTAHRDPAAGDLRSLPLPSGQAARGSAVQRNGSSLRQIACI